MKMSSAFAFILLLPSPGVSAGPPRGSWDEVAALATASRIKVEVKGGETQSGAFAGLTETSLLLSTKKMQVALAKEIILRVEAKGKSHRLRNAIIGAGVGLALGLLVDQSAGAYMRNEGTESAAARFGTYSVPIALSSGIGAALPSWRTVYRAPAR